MALDKINKDEFYMWRTLFAMVHADHKVREQEMYFMAEAIESIPFTEEQVSILKDDIYTPKNIMNIFSHVQSTELEARFFKFAHKLVWIDGEYHEEEQAIMIELLRTHIHKMDFDQLIKNIDLEFEQTALSNTDHKPCDVKKWLHSFKSEFFSKGS